MAIGTLAAIGLGAAGAGSFLGGKSQSKAATKAAQATAQASDQSAAVTQQIYGQNQAALAPYQGLGLPAGQQLNSMLGLGQPQQTAQQFGAPQIESLYSGPNPEAGGWGGAYAPAQGYGTGSVHMPSGVSGDINSQDPFRQYIANSDYGFQFGEGANRINSGFAGAGTLQSGAAMKAMEDYRQNLQQGYRGEYMDRLAGQQNVGFGAASAQAGVGQNFANSMSNIYQNRGDNAANAAMLKGQNNPFANSLGTIGGGLFRIGMK